MKLRTRPVEAEAVKWVGEVEGRSRRSGEPEPVSDHKDGTPGEHPTYHNIDYILDFVGEDNVRMSGHGLRLRHREVDWVTVPLNHYVIKRADGHLVVLSESELVDQYEGLA